VRLLIAATTLLLLFPSTASARAHAVQVRGGWIGAIPCLITSYTPSPDAPTTGAIYCTSGTLWDGGWTGQTMYTVHGKINFLTGDSSGTLKETFYGIYTADDSQGTLTFVERYKLDGATNGLHIDLKITGGTGDWVGSRGTSTFDGTQFLGLAGHGGYSATWIRP
jgi:hypothetical protein